MLISLWCHFVDPLFWAILGACVRDKLEAADPHNHLGGHAHCSAGGAAGPRAAVGPLSTAIAAALMTHARLLTSEDVVSVVVVHTHNRMRRRNGRRYMATSQSHPVLPVE